MPFASRSSTRAGLLVAAVVAAAVVAIVGLAVGRAPLSLGGLTAAVVAAGGLALYLIVSERRRHELAEEELTAQASFLETLVAATSSVASLLDSAEILEQTRREAERLFGGRATMLAPGEAPAGEPDLGTIVVPLRARQKEIAALRLERGRPFARWDVARATVLADFAARACDNARLLAEAQVREAERARLSDQLITAEQDERRRLALFLHDGAVQSLSGIALMLDAAQQAIADGRSEEAKRVIASSLDRHRETIRSLRDLSFNLEPVVLRDQGFGPAVRALAEQLGIASKIQIELDIEAAEALAERAQVVLYQIIREALNGAIRRGPPTRISVRIRETDEGSVETVIADDGAGERRRASFEALAERARPLNGRVSTDPGPDGGTVVRIALPAYTARH